MMSVDISGAPRIDVIPWFEAAPFDSARLYSHNRSKNHIRKLKKFSQNKKIETEKIKIIGKKKITYCN